MNVRTIKVCIVVCLLASVVSCSTLKRPAELGKEIEWRQVDGWQADNHAEAWPALLNSCKALRAHVKWKNLCLAAQNNVTPNNEQARLFFERWFAPHQLYGERRKTTGLITGYYEPLLFGSYTRGKRYRYPLYAPPETMLTIELGDLFPDLKNQRVRGRLVGKKVLPFYSREQIESNRSLLAGNELIWVDDRDAVFFLHIQGSGRIQLPNGKIIGVGYDDQNGHPYSSIGARLLRWGELEREEISLFTIRDWLRNNPAHAEKLLFSNPSYVFFVLRENIDSGPIGSLNVPLTAERSIAIDPKLVELGIPIWLSTNVPGEPEHEYRRLVFAQDTGGAITGTLRADLFWGHGSNAERAAGIMKEEGNMVVLLPKVD